MAAPLSPPAVRAWKPALPGVREVFQAGRSDHAYPPHTHDAWTLFIVDSGAIRYDLDRRGRSADPAFVSLLPPYVVHDGRPADHHGYAMRVLYVEPDVLGEALIGPAVDRPVLPDPRLVRRLGRVHDALACPEDVLEAELRFNAVIERIQTLLGGVAVEPTSGGDQALAEAFRCYLDDRILQPVTMAAAARDLGAGPTRLARAFTDMFAIAPHAYLTGRRLEIARGHILEGRALADVATAVGFCDQAHLTRRFRQFLGTTPARYRRWGRSDPRSAGPTSGRRSPSRPRGS